MDAEEFKKAATEMIDFITDYVKDIRDRPVLPSVEPGYLNDLLPNCPPEEGQPWSEILPDVEKYIMPGMTHWHSPRFHAYFPTAQSYPSILADMLTGALGCIGFSWIASPACTELEMKVMNWLADMIGLPEDFKFNTTNVSSKGGGVIQGTASEATLVALLGAKARAINLVKKMDIDDTIVQLSLSSKILLDLNNNTIQQTATDGNNNNNNNNSNNDDHLNASPTTDTNKIMTTTTTTTTNSEQIEVADRSSCQKQDEQEQEKQSTVATNKLLTVDRLVGYCSELAHSSVERAGLLAGVKIISVQSDDDCRLRGETLRKQIEEDKRNGLIPFFAVCTLGTTSVCTFDDLYEMGQVCQEHNIWLHVDAAYAGSAFVCPEFRHFMKGVELCDSFNFNPHKWLLVNFDCSAFWIKDSHYMVDAFNVDPLYLKYEQQGRIPDYRHWQIPLGRRFRSLKIWFVVRSYGIVGLQKYIREHVELAKYFESLVSGDDRFIVTHPVTMGLVCFRLKHSDEYSEILVKKINENKNIHLCPSKVKGRYIIRFAICAKSTNKHDIDFSWSEILRLTDELFLERQ